MECSKFSLRISKSVKRVVRVQKDTPKKKKKKPE